jgi:hypothetical protein
MTPEQIVEAMVLYVLIVGFLKMASASVKVALSLKKR